MILLRLLNGQGIAGLAAALCLGLLLVVQKGETRHWHKQSDQFQSLYRQSETAKAETVASYRQAAAEAERADRAAAAQIASVQNQINQRSDDAFQTRLADARDRAQRLRDEAAGAPAHSGSGRAPPVSGLAASAAQPAQTPGQDRLPVPDALIATEQAIQLDELIKWVESQAAIDPNAEPPATP